MARPVQTSKTLPPRVLPSVDTPVDAGSFLEKRSYRRRRMTDGLRVLPIFGFWLFMVPLMWPGAAARLTGTAVSMSSALIYIFAVWTVLIILCATLSKGQGRSGLQDVGATHTQDRGDS